MAFWMQPFYKSDLALNIADAFAAASELALRFSIRELDRENLRIVLNLTSMPSPIFFFTWIRAYVIRVHFLEENLSRIRVQAKPVFSPHHFLRLPFFLTHRIEQEEFRRDLRRHFARFEKTAAPPPPPAMSNYPTV